MILDDFEVTVLISYLIRHTKENSIMTFAFHVKLNNPDEETLTFRQIVI